MPKGVKTSDLEVLKKAGFDIKPALSDYVFHRELEKDGIVELWRCPCHEFKAVLKTTGVDCPKGHEMRLVWQAGQP